MPTTPLYICEECGRPAEQFRRDINITRDANGREHSSPGAIHAYCKLHDPGVDRRIDVTTFQTLSMSADELAEYRRRQMRETVAREIRKRRDI